MLGIETDYYVSRALDINYAALALAVYGGGDISPEYAMSRIENGTRGRIAIVAETVEMVRLANQGYSYRTIDKMLNKSGFCSWQRVKNWRDKHESDI